MKTKFTRLAPSIWRGGDALTINVPVVYGAVRSGFEGGLSITRGILGGGRGGLKIETDTSLNPPLFSIVPYLYILYSELKLTNIKKCFFAL